LYGKNKNNYKTDFNISTRRASFTNTNGVRTSGTFMPYLINSILVLVFFINRIEKSMYISLMSGR